MKGLPEIQWVDTADGLNDVAAVCRAAGRFALDTEADSFHSYFHRVCLVQVSADNTHWVIDPLAIEIPDFKPLWELTADPEIDVLMHGADYDVRILDRDYGARIQGLVDTQIMAQLLGEPQTGLGALLDKELGLKVDKRYQRANWKMRPLSPSHLEYAAADTAHLDCLVRRMCDRLKSLGRDEWAKEEFKRLESVRFVEPPSNGLAFERVKGARKLKGRDRDRVYSLFLWRDQEAQQRDVPPFKVLGNAPLVALATEPPVSVSQLSRVPGVGPRIAGRSGKQILAVLNLPAEAPDRQPSKPKSVLDPSRKEILKKMVVIVDGVGVDLGLSRGLLCPRATLDALVSQENLPSSAAELERCGLVGWRLKVLSESLLDTIKG
ncbi:MAG: ribonuclease D [bacterium]|nr:ribonuclease D [bacterium]